MIRWPGRQPHASAPSPSHGSGVWTAEPAWWVELGFSGGPPSSMDAVEARFRRLASQAHPDRGGSSVTMQRLNRARAQARRQLHRL